MKIKLETNYQKPSFQKFGFFTNLPKVISVIGDYLKLKQVFLIINLVDEITMQKIKNQYYPFQKQSTVLTFPLLTFAQSQLSELPWGELYFSYPLLLKKNQAKLTSLDSSLLEFFLHSFLHLCGHDHLFSLEQAFMEKTSLELKLLVEKKLFN